jgi:hypothetical protein
MNLPVIVNTYKSRIESFSVDSGLPTETKHNAWPSAARLCRSGPHALVRLSPLVSIFLFEVSQLVFKDSTG